MVNTTTLIGRLTKKPENKVIKRKGKEPLSVCNVRLAVNATEDTAYFIPVTFFGKTADAVCKYCAKGDKIAVNGYLRTESWENDDGDYMEKTSVVANQVEFMSKGKSADKSNRKKSDDKSTRKRKKTDEYDECDDEYDECDDE